MKHPVAWLRGHLARLRGVQEVVPGELYIGSLKAAQREAHRFPLVVSIGSDKLDDATIHLDINDNERIPSWALRRFERVIPMDEPLLIHCEVGRSRSAAFATLWLMKRLNTSWDIAYRYLQHQCPSTKVAPELRASVESWFQPYDDEVRKL